VRKVSGKKPDDEKEESSKEEEKNRFKHIDESFAEIRRDSGSISIVKD